MSCSGLIWKTVEIFGRTWFDFKSGLEAFGVIQDQALHILLGVVLQLLFAALARRSIGSLIPWSAVLLLELANEWADLRFSTWPGVEAHYGASAIDLAVTMALPTVLLIVSRRIPHLLTMKPA